MTSTSYYPVSAMYRQAVKHTPFCRSVAFLHSRHAKADGVEGTLTLNPSTNPLPQLELFEATGADGEPATHGRVRVYDALLRVIWDGVFDYTAGAWVSWRINRWRNGKGRGDLMGKTTYGSPDKDMPVAWLTHDGRGATVTYAKNSLSHVGYNGVTEDGRLKYAYLTRDKALRPHHEEYGPSESLGAPLASCWIVPDSSRDQPTRRLEWGAGDLGECYANNAMPLCFFEVGRPVALPHFSNLHRANRRHNDHTPLKEAFWLAHYVEGYDKLGQVSPTTMRQFTATCKQYRAALVMRYDPASVYMVRLAEKLRRLANYLPARSLDNVLDSYGPESARHTPALLHLFGRDLAGTAELTASIIDAKPKAAKPLDSFLPYSVDPDTGTPVFSPEAWRIREAWVDGDTTYGNVEDEWLRIEAHHAGA